MRQERSLSWKEAKIFAYYMIEDKMIYELSNRQIVVRWSQAMSPFLVVTANNTDVEEDWYDLINRVNKVVVAHTDLPLLNLSDYSKTH